MSPASTMLKTVSAVLAGAVLGASVLLAWQLHGPGSASRGAETSAPEPDGAACPKFNTSPLATKYLDTLHGIEIGASTQNSFDLKRSVNVDFSDEQGGLWQDEDCEPATVNIVALGDDLPFKDNTVDYVLSSHVIEHFFDPVKALREWPGHRRQGRQRIHGRHPEVSRWPRTTRASHYRRIFAAIRADEPGRGGRRRRDGRGKFPSKIDPSARSQYNSQSSILSLAIKEESSC
jgi:SAM-dependent methyltransferase